MKKINPFVLVAVGVVVLLGLMWAGKPVPKDNQHVADAPKSASASSGALFLSESSYDFGSISMAAGNVSREVVVKNNSAEPMNLESLLTSCMCTTAFYVKGGETAGPFGMPGHVAVPKLNRVLGPGESATIKIVFDPAAHGPSGVGPISRMVTLTSATGEAVNFSFNALVTP